MLGRWTWGRPAKAVGECLAAARVTGPVAVVDAPPLARLLGERGTRVVPLARSERALRQFRDHAARAAAAALPLRDGALDALVAASSDALGALAESCRAVRDGGVVILVGTEEPEETSRRALCAGLVELEQREAGRAVVTSGTVRRV
jgi:hypothetical protein